MDNNNQEVIQWSYDYLLSHGYILNSNLPQKIQQTPWSYVTRFTTSAGYIYLKQTPESLALEANILQMLKNQFNVSVPVVIAQNVDLNCFLMKDAGKPLREILKEQFNVELICKTINQFTSIQLSIANHINHFIHIGVPDWRLNKLPDLFNELLTQKNLLIADGLSEKEIRRLTLLTPIVTNLCNELSAYAIPQTIVQPDFNDNNTLLDESQNITFIDLGEITISHPFFSLLNFLQQIRKHYALNENDSIYLNIKNACLNNYMLHESQENVLNAFELARPLWLIYSCLAGLRLVNACSKSNIMLYQHGKLAYSLKELISLIT